MDDYCTYCHTFGHIWTDCPDAPVETYLDAYRPALVTEMLDLCDLIGDPT